VPATFKGKSLAEASGFPATDGDRQPMVEFRIVAMRISTAFENKRFMIIVLRERWLL
jgi:hypothetical protein